MSFKSYHNGKLSKYSRRSVRLFHVAILSVMTLYGTKINDSLTSSVIEESRDDTDGTNRSLYR